jgi:hypothetical protein
MNLFFAEVSYVGKTRELDVVQGQRTPTRKYKQPHTDTPIIDIEQKWNIIDSDVLYNRWQQMCAYHMLKKNQHQTGYLYDIYGKKPTSHYFLRFHA